MTFVLYGLKSYHDTKWIKNFVNHESDILLEHFIALSSFSSTVEELFQFSIQIILVRDFSSF
jgi:hypothetical protein